MKVGLECFKLKITEKKNIISVTKSAIYQYGKDFGNGRVANGKNNYLAVVSNFRFQFFNFFNWQAKYLFSVENESTQYSNGMCASSSKYRYKSLFTQKAHAFHSF